MSTTRTTESTRTARERSRILECRSSVVTRGDVQMSAATATRITAQLLAITPGDGSVR